MDVDTDKEKQIQKLDLKLYYLQVDSITGFFLEFGKCITALLTTQLKKNS